MEGKLKVVAETPYGPRLEIVESAESEKPERVDQGRRNFIKAGLAAGALVATGAGLEKISSLSEKNESVVKEEESNEGLMRETVEQSLNNNFEKELTGYKALTQLKKDELLFVDEYNQPVGAPVKLQNFVDKKYKSDGSLAFSRYLYSPGEFNEAGIVEKGIPGEWIDYVRNRVQAHFPEQPINNYYHVVEDFKKAYQEDDEPELVSRIADGEIKEYLDIPLYFANKPVVGDTGKTRLEYVREAIEFSDSVPEVVQTELRRLIPGLCAQESKFNAGLTSKTGAKGIFQFMPETWEYYGGKKDEYISLKRQAQIAGQFLSDLYDQVQSKLSPEAFQTLAGRFHDLDEFRLELVVPMMINAYNTGAARIAEAAELYTEAVQENDMPSGKDLFRAIADFAEQYQGGKYLSGYGKHSREYVPRVYAQAEVLRGKG